MERQRGNILLACFFCALFRTVEIIPFKQSQLAPGNTDAQDTVRWWGIGQEGTL
jgi:hypothetical protein